VANTIALFIYIFLTTYHQQLSQLDPAVRIEIPDSQTAEITNHDKQTPLSYCCLLLRWLLVTKT